MKFLWLAVVLLGIGSTPAYSKPRHVVLHPSCNITMPCEGGFYSARAQKFMGIPFGAPLQHYVPQRPKQQISVPERRRVARRHVTPQRITRSVVSRDHGTVIGARPSGCPHAYCGCSASLYLFGKIIPRLNLAANWLSFPKAAPAPKMAAARHGHVFVLVEHKGGDKWLVHDGNSGRGMTRLHVRSLAGYTVVNPNG